MNYSFIYRILPISNARSLGSWIVKFFLASILCILGFTIPVLAQTVPYPTRSIKVLYPFPPGAGDALSRLIGDKLAGRMGQAWVLEHRPGASGNIAVDAVSKAPADGYTLGWIVDFNLTINPAVYKQLPFDVLRDLAPVSTYAIGDAALVVHPSVPANTLAEFIALARKQALSFSSGGNGSPGQMAGEYFKKEFGTPQLQHIPYKGTAPAVQSVLAGETQAFFGVMTGTLAHVRAGKLRALAVLAPQRSPFLPDVPTAVELGYPRLQIATWYGLIAPAGTPRSVITRIAQEMPSVMQEKDIVQMMENTALRPFVKGPDEMQNMIKEQGSTWATIVRENNIQVE